MKIIKAEKNPAAVALGKLSAEKRNLNSEDYRKEAKKLVFKPLFWGCGKLKGKNRENTQTVI